MSVHYVWLCHISLESHSCCGRPISFKWSAMLSNKLNWRSPVQWASYYSQLHHLYVHAFVQIFFKHIPSFHIKQQGSINYMHREDCARNVIAKRFLHAHKSIKTPLSSTPIVFKIVSYYCVWKQIIFSTIWSDIHNFFQLRSRC